MTNPPQVRYWDGESAYVDCVVVWSGRGGMPHEVRNREFWRTKACQMLEYAPGHPTPVRSVDGTRPAAAVHYCQCGKRITDKAWERHNRTCYPCKNARRQR